MLGVEIAVETGRGSLGDRNDSFLHSISDIYPIGYVELLNGDLIRKHFYQR